MRRKSSSWRMTCVPVESRCLTEWRRWEMLRNPRQHHHPHNQHHHPCHHHRHLNYIKCSLWEPTPDWQKCEMWWRGVFFLFCYHHHLFYISFVVIIISCWYSSRFPFDMQTNFLLVCKQISFWYANKFHFDIQGTIFQRWKCAKGK